MTAILQTSSSFACATASGADWRDVGRKVLEALESVRTEGDGMNIGFIYATPQLAGDMTALLSLLKTVTRINAWYGATGQGICGGGVSHASGPAAVAMIGKMPEGSFTGFSIPENDTGTLPANLRAWLSGHMASCSITHGILCAQGAQHLRHMRERDGLYTLGGFTAAAQGGLHISEGNVVRSGEPLSGVIFDGNVRLMSAAAFGCIPAGRTGRISKCAGNVIEMIDDMPASVFLHDAIDQLHIEDPDPDRARHGHVHAAFPITGSDRANFLMRNITEVDDTKGHITVAHAFERGDSIRFVYRDRVTASADLSQVSTGLYARAADEHGAANVKPKAILYFGCGARLPTGDATDEAAILKAVFGDVPMAGFYTAAEISNGHVYGYTGIIVLLL